MRGGIGVRKKAEEVGEGGEEMIFCPSLSPCSFSHSLAVSIPSRAFGNDRECPFLQPPLSCFAPATTASFQVHSAASHHDNGRGGVVEVFCYCCYALD